MKGLISLIVLALASQTYAASITVAPAPNITRNAGQTIPVTFTCSGFRADQTVQFWLVNAKNWTRELVDIDVPVVNGTNHRDVRIPWSWYWTAPYVVDVVGPGVHYMGSQIIRIRSAIIWPYSGTIYPRGKLAWIVWVTSNLEADFLSIIIHNEDTGEQWLVGDHVDPYLGRLQFLVPDTDGNHFRFLIEGYLSVTELDPVLGDYEFDDLNVEAQSEPVAIH